MTMLQFPPHVNIGYASFDRVSELFYRGGSTLPAFLPLPPEASHYWEYPIPDPWREPWLDKPWVGPLPVDGPVEVPANDDLKIALHDYDALHMRDVLDVLAGQRLVAIELIATMITDTNLVTLADAVCAMFPAVTTLNLSHCWSLRDGALERVREMQLQALGFASLNPEYITDAALVAVPCFAELEYLDLADNQFSDEGLAVLRQLPKLRSLNLSSTGISDAGIRHLLPCEQLEDLALVDTVVTDHGVALLGTLPQLKRLKLMGTPATFAGAQFLIDRGVNLYTG